MVAILHFSDIHVDRREPLLAAEEAAAAQREVRAAFTRICQLAVEFNVDALCCAGNLYDQASATEDTFEFVRHGFAGLGSVAVFIAPGATDWLDAGSPYRRAGFFTDNVHVFTDPYLRARPLHGLTVWGAGFETPNPPVGFLNGFATDRPGVHVALFHGCEASSGAVPLVAPFTAGQVRSCGLSHALVGGLPAAFSAADHTYPGTPAPRGEAERTGGGVALLRIDEMGVVVRDRYGVIDALPSAPPPPSREEVSEVWETSDVWEGSEFSEVEAIPGWLAAVLAAEHPADELYRIEEIGREHTARGEFVRAVRAAGLAHDEAAVRRIGLLALDDRLRPGGW